MGYSIELNKTSFLFFSRKLCDVITELNYHRYIYLSFIHNVRRRTIKIRDLGWVRQLLTIIAYYRS